MADLLTPEDRQTVVRLLGKLYGRLNGALDAWTVLCLDQASMRLNPQEFVARHADALRSLAVVIRSVLAEGSCNQSLADELVADSERLQGVFAVLAGHRNATRQEVRAATQTLGEIYRRMLQAIGQLGEALDCQGEPWQRRTPQQEEYFEGILGRLFDLFEQARQAEGQTTSAAVGH